MSKIPERVWLKNQRSRERERLGGHVEVRTDYAFADTSWSCARKKSYSSESFAVDVARRMRADRDADVVVYACRHCGSWHIGRAPRVS